MANSAWRPEPPFESGGGGLVSTIDDYFAFSRMMLNKGRHGREQILSRAAVELMTSDQLTPEQRAGSEIFFGTHSQLGLRNGGGHPAQRNLPHPGPIRLERRLRHNGLHRSCGGNDRHPLHAAHDGFAGTAEGIHRLLDAGVRSNGIALVRLTHALRARTLRIYQGVTASVSRRGKSSDDFPIMISKSPGTTRQCMSRSSNCRSSGVNVSVTVFVSPGSRSTLFEAAQLLHGR